MLNVREVELFKAVNRWAEKKIVSAFFNVELIYR